MELSILNWIQGLRFEVLDTFFRWYTALGDHAELWIVILLILMINKNTRKIAWYAALLLIVEVIVNDGIIKPLIHRIRPFDVSFIELIIEMPGSYSFPSGHTASSFVVAFFLYLNNIRFKRIILCLAALMGFSRLYLYVHYPSDVIAGALLGMAIAWVGYRLLMRWNLLAAQKPLIDA